jgi:hypothetical protein
MNDRGSESYRRVALWIDGYRRSWGDQSDEPATKLEQLDAFCAFAGKNPDEIIDDCLRPVAGGYEQIRYKARHHYIDLIAEFEKERGRDAGNTIRSFFIHNGVAMGGRVSL